MDKNGLQIKLIRPGFHWMWYKRPHEQRFLPLEKEKNGKGRMMMNQVPETFISKVMIFWQQQELDLRSLDDFINLKLTHV